MVIEYNDYMIAGDNYFAKKMKAIGPWHAKFLFCGWYKYHPNEVKVTQSNTGEYWCHVGEFPGYQILECM